MATSTQQFDNKPRPYLVYSQGDRPKRWPWTWLSAAIRNVRLAMYLALFVVLLLAWITGFLMFHVAGALIHILLLVAFVSLIMHFVRGSSASA